MKSTQLKKNLTKWNRKIHIHLGLFLLLFIWLFGLSGMLLNNNWEFANSWPDRKVTSYDKTIEISKERDQNILVVEIMDKLDLDGDIYNLWISSDSTQLGFVAAKPGTRYDVQTGLVDGKTTVKETILDGWAVMRSMHTQRNPTQVEEVERHQPLMSFIWGISLDVVSVGLIIICLGGWYLWLQAERKRIYMGLISLAGGFILCVYILFF